MIEHDITQLIAPEICGSYFENIILKLTVQNTSLGTAIVLH